MINRVMGTKPSLNITNIGRTSKELELG